MGNLLPNIPLKELTSDTDCFGTLERYYSINSFFNIFSDSLDDIKMIALYGKWGCGKSTLMEKLKEELKINDKYKTFFFEAWKYEKDENLALSLIDFLRSENQKIKKEIIKELVKTTAFVLKGFAKGFKIETPFLPGLPKLSFDYNNYIKSIEDDFEKEEENQSTFSNHLKKFKKSYEDFENEITNNNNRIIIFIDDLDRCEPENLLNLLSAIKLFFTLGKKTIFFCGLDKDAVCKAIKTKYQDIIKSEEYLEKIFDVSFNMPEYFNVKKMLNQYSLRKNSVEIALFFEKIGFTNPMHIKKVLNKYEILICNKQSGILNEQYRELIPNIFIDDKGNLLETVLVLYIIILYEFYHNRFDEIDNVNNKTHKYTILSSDIAVILKTYREQYDNIKNNFLKTNYKIRTTAFKHLYNKYKELSESAKNKSDGHLEINRFKKELYFIFTPTNINKIDSLTDIDIPTFIQLFDIPENKFIVDFIKYFDENFDSLFAANQSGASSSAYTFEKLFIMAKTLL